MALTRRTGLAALAGAIFGGPQAAKAAVNYGASTVRVPTPSQKQYDNAYEKIGAETEDPMAAVARRARHREDLIARANGKLNPYEENELAEQAVPYKCRLKSVSKQYKKIMEVEHYKEVRRQNWMNYAKQELFNVFGIKL